MSWVGLTPYLLEVLDAFRTFNWEKMEIPSKIIFLVLGHRNFMTFGEIILYTTEDGSTSIQLRAEEGTAWLTQAEIANLFQTSPQNITLHIKSIYAEKELMSESTCKELLQVRLEGDREIHRNLKIMILNY